MNVDIGTFVIGTFLISLVTGGLAGAAMAAWLRRRGKVRCIVPWVSPTFTEGPGANDTLWIDFPLRFYNEREVGTSIGDPTLHIYDGSGSEVHSSILKERGEDEWLRYLDLPPQASVFKQIEFRMHVPKNLSLNLGESPYTLSWHYPDGERDTQKIPTPGF
jgi:hypothetical protein